MQHSKQHICKARLPTEVHFLVPETYVSQEDKHESNQMTNSLGKLLQFFYRWFSEVLSARLTSRAYSETLLLS
jgi:hypothetical protein